ncbi:small acid-soluble spore protein Tlp [Paenibacillus sp. NEAU-GSW1]|uniref:small acid-soluble spore protein Tlp n=1 Tax=Paenibacillus sp. NEAU-GSW1 TaxID=2682486 RepID=UPI0012E2299F|nr:small acid-soluble spore protein Tlp [Paenibacillus sp. NEAU-GSW1]MUT65647.1 small acid-soluble spore protein Tlp [Paenibacillus sp. NEAU-GSW1]
MAKPDNREDNAQHLQSHIEHTKANLQEAEDYLDEHAEEISAVERQAIEKKNQNRKQSINEFAAEIADET